MKFFGMQIVFKPELICRSTTKTVLVEVYLQKCTYMSRNFLTVFFLGLTLFTLNACSLGPTTLSHTEEFNGVNITFGQPFLFQKKGFVLRGLPKKDTEIVVDAMDSIAGFIWYISEGRPPTPPGFVVGLLNSKQPRAVYDYTKIKEIHFPATYIKNWKIEENKIQFTVDYLIQRGIPGKTFEEFRDGYIFEKHGGRWIFVDYLTAEPVGILPCLVGRTGCPY
jgi:hypothetical protein